MLFNTCQTTEHVWCECVFPNAKARKCLLFNWETLGHEEGGESGNQWKRMKDFQFQSSLLSSFFGIYDVIENITTGAHRAPSDWPLTGYVPLVTYHIRSLNNSLSISRAWWIWGAHFSIVNLGLSTEMVLPLAGSQREELRPWQMSWGRRFCIRKGGIEPQESPWKFLSIYPQKQSLPTFCFVLSPTPLTLWGAVPHYLSLKKELTYSSS